jgi:hypothetical protein
MEPAQQPDYLKERLIALRERITEDGKKRRRMLADMEARRFERGTARPSLPELVKREEFDALEARVAMLERSGRGRS